MGIAPVNGIRFIALACTSVALLAAADVAKATDFTISPDISSGNISTYSWSISIDNATASANPDLEVKTGTTYQFFVNTNFIHPFWIDQNPGLGGSIGTNPYAVGDELSDNGVESNTTITMNLGTDAPSTLYYACGNHSSMHGTINVVFDLVYRSNFE